MIKREAGFTTLELVVAMAIGGIIMAAVGTFLTFSMRSFNSTKDIIDVQYESQLSINQMTKLLKESTGILDITDSGGTPSSSAMARIDKPRTLSFEVEKKTAATKSYVLGYDDTTKKMTMAIDGATPYVVGQFVEDFAVEPLDGKSFIDADGINIEMIFVDGDARIDVSSQVKFRNK